MVRFIGTNSDHPIVLATSMGDTNTAVGAARSFLSVYGPLFGLATSVDDVSLLRIGLAQNGRVALRFQQMNRGLPVMGGELIVHVDEGRGIIAAIGELCPDLHLDLTPVISPQEAQQIALAELARIHRLGIDDLETTAPELWIYNPALLGGPGPRLSRLVWRMDVRSKHLPPVNELVLVDAHLGLVARHFNQVETGLFREIYDNSNNGSLGLPGNGPVRSEGEPSTGIPDVDAAYSYLGDAYTYYANVHGRDGIDDQGMPVVATVRYCPDWSDPGFCPFPNAFWSGSQIAFGEGFAQADDVVAHEFTHGVTDYESNLFYYMQSGAINEALSDIWGEFVDQVNGAGTDASAVRWLIGEDVSNYGPFRSMADPALYGDPDSMTSSNYYCGRNDSGGVHTNNGVGNKAAYLMVDGGSFNDQIVDGLGMINSARIWYEAQTNLLTSAADYQDLYDALQQACINLIGLEGITSDDCQQVSRVVQATEMLRQPAACPANEAPLCPPWRSPVDSFFDDLEDVSSGNWSHSALSSSDGWYYPQNAHSIPGFDATYASSGQINFWGSDPSVPSDSLIAMTSDVLLPPSAYAYFKHAYAFDAEGETIRDGGLVEYSVDGGNTWSDAGPLFTHNGYTGTILSTGGNPLAGRPAFGGESYGYISSRLDLSGLAGERIRIRFRIGTDNWGGAYGWFIDDVRIYTCVGPALGNRTYLPIVLNR